MTEKKSRVFVFGGARGIGFWFARKILSNHLNDIDVHICDIDTPRTIAPNSDFYWHRVAYEDGFIDGVPEDLGNNDIVIISVPIDYLGDLLERLKKHVKGSPQIINFSSVQSETNSQIQKEMPDTCVIYGLHLLFGPGVSHPAGNNAVVTDLDYKHGRDDVSRFLKLVEDSGLYLEYSSSEKHDAMMQVLQVGVHYTFFAFAKYLQDSEIDFSELLKYRTLPAGFFLSFMARALSQPKRTYANIQRQEGSEEARKAISESFLRLQDELASAGTPDDSERIIRDISEYFKHDDLLEGVAATQAAVKAYELASREVHDSIHNKVLVGITVAGGSTAYAETRLGFVLNEKRGSIEFDDRLRELSIPIDGKSFALLSNQPSIDYFSSKGISYSKKKYPLSKKRFNFLPNSYVERWIKDNVALAQISFPIIIKRFDQELIAQTEELLPKRIDALESIEFGKLFIAEDKTVHAVCFVRFFPFVEVEAVKLEILNAVASFIELS